MTVYWKIPLFLETVANTIYSDKYGWGKESWGGSPWGYGWYIFDYGNLCSVVHSCDSRINTFKDASLKYGKIFLLSDSNNEVVYYTTNDDPITYRLYDWTNGINLGARTTAIYFFLNYPLIFGVPYSLFKTYEITTDPSPWYNDSLYSTIPTEVLKKQVYVSNRNVQILLEDLPAYRNRGQMTVHALLAAYELCTMLRLSIFPKITAPVPRTWRIKDINIIGRDILHLSPKYQLEYDRTNSIKNVVSLYLRDMFGS